MGTALLQKTRRGLARGLESAPEGQPEKKEQGGQEAIIFHPVKMRNNQRRRVQHEHLTEDHQELITFVAEGWVRVKRDGAGGRGSCRLPGYDKSNPGPLSALRPRCMVGTKALSGFDKWSMTLGASYGP